MAPGYVKTDPTGRIIEVKFDEAVTDPNSPLAVQALPVQREDRRPEGPQDEKVDADHPLAVQALPVEEHPLLVHLEEDEQDAAREARDTANEAQQGTGHPETPEASEAVLEPVVPAAEVEAVAEAPAE